MKNLSKKVVRDAHYYLGFALLAAGTGLLWAWPASLLVLGAGLAFPPVAQLVKGGG